MKRQRERKGASVPSLRLNRNTATTLISQGFWVTSPQRDQPQQPQHPDCASRSRTREKLRGSGGYPTPLPVVAWPGTPSPVRFYTRRRSTICHPGALGSRSGLPPDRLAFRAFGGRPQSDTGARPPLSAAGSPRSNRATTTRRACPRAARALLSGRRHMQSVLAESLIRRARSRTGVEAGDGTGADRRRGTHGRGG